MSKKNINKKRIAIFTKRFVQVGNNANKSYQQICKIWSKGEVVWNEINIDELMLVNAPIEIYCQDVNRPAEG